MLYADDTVIYSKSGNLRKAARDMQKDLNSLQRWCQTNGIFVNIKKNKFMVFGSKSTLSKVKTINIELKIENEKYLGITLDEQLNYELHAQSVIKAVKYKTLRLRLLRRILNKKAALLVYKNMILPILEYGDVFLSSVSKATRKKVQVMQNNCLRIALNLGKRESSKMLHESADLAKLYIRRKVHVLQFLFKLKRERHLFTRLLTGGIKTLSSKKINFLLRRPRPEKFRSCISNAGFKLWNNLPHSIQKLDEPDCFKFRIKKLFTHSTVTAQVGLNSEATL